MQPVTRIRLFGFRLAACVLAAYWSLIFFGTHLPKLPAATQGIPDKVAHFTAFFGLALLLCYVTNSTRLWRRFGSIVVLCVAYGIIDEVTQSLVRGRQTDVLDLLADTAGTLLAVGLYSAARWVWQRRSTFPRSTMPQVI